MNDTHGEKGRGWIGVDLDGTLALYGRWVSPEHIGSPIPLMLDRVRKWLGEGKLVKIMTARVHPSKEDHIICRAAIERWLIQHVGEVLPITHEKDHFMLELWDDRVIQVEKNTGRRVDGLD